ncbi:MAG: Excinuclease ABC C subunit protein [uncultured bacterium]|nr:MAG: Excinuclease ABC C subunit protein [uncultured bacterium]HAO51851.1 excinuclease ABC subunit C [Candidatus Magasanikbacteria bacterium]
MYYVYILKSLKDNSRYVGFTNDLKRRIKEHNSGESTYTKGHLPWKLIWYCAFIDKLSASNFEKYLKSGSGIAFINKRLV